MHKINKTEQGFTVIETIAVLIVIVLVCAVGYMVYINSHKTVSSKTLASNSTNSYKGWKTYHDNHFGFSYPPSWQINQSSFGPGPYVTLTSPKSAIQPYIKSDPIYPSSIEDLNLFLFYNPPGQASCLSNNCTVKIIEPLKIKDIPNARLVIYSKNNPTSTCPGVNAHCVTANSPDEFEVTNSLNEKVGDSTVPYGLTIENKFYQFTGCIQTGTKNSNITEQECATINNFSAFEASSNYKNLVKVLDSLTIN